MLHYNKQDGAAATFVAAIASACYALFSESLVDMRTLAWLQAGGGILGVSSKIPQIWTIWQQGGTGQLSAFAVSIFLLQSIALQPVARIANLI